MSVNAFIDKQEVVCQFMQHEFRHILSVPVLSMTKPDDAQCGRSRATNRFL